VYLPNKQHQCGKQLKTDHDILKMTEILNSRDGAIQHIWKTIDAIYSIKSNVAIKHTHTHTLFVIRNYFTNNCCHCQR